VAPSEERLKEPPEGLGQGILTFVR